MLSTFTVCFNPLRFSLTLEPSFIAAVTLLTCTAEETFPAPALSLPVETPADAAIKLKSSFAVTSVASFALIVAFSTMASTLLFEISAIIVPPAPDFPFAATTAAVSIKLSVDFALTVTSFSALTFAPSLIDAETVFLAKVKFIPPAAAFVSLSGFKGLV